MMPKFIATHEVDDVAHWLASTKLEEIFGNVAKNITRFVEPGGANRVALYADVTDMEAFDAANKSDANAAAMKEAGVRPDTLVVYMES